MWIPQSEVESHNPWSGCLPELGSNNIGAGDSEQNLVLLDVERQCSSQTFRSASGLYYSPQIQRYTHWNTFLMFHEAHKDQIINSHKIYNPNVCNPYEPTITPAEFKIHLIYNALHQGKPPMNPGVHIRSSIFNYCIMSHPVVRDPMSSPKYLWSSIFNYPWAPEHLRVQYSSTVQCLTLC